VPLNCRLPFMTSFLAASFMIELASGAVVVAEKTGPAAPALPAAPSAVGADAMPLSLSTAVVVVAVLGIVPVAAVFCSLTRRAVADDVA